MIDAIDRKLLRDFKRLWLQALAIALVMACGVAVLLMSIGMSRALDDTRATYYERQRFADLFVQARRAPLSMLPQVQALDGVALAEARVVAQAILDLPGRDRIAVGEMVSLPEIGLPELNIPLLRSGRWPDPDEEDAVVVNEPFAKANGFRLDDTFQANLNGRKRVLRIVGTALSPEYIYTIGPGQLMPDNETFGILWMTHGAVSAAFDMNGAFNSLALLLVPGAAPGPVRDALDDLLDPYGGLGVIDRTQQQSNAFIDAEIAQLKTLAYILPPVFLGITVFLVNMVIGRIVALERAEIGLLKAIGYSDVEILFHYLLLAGLIAALGVGIGWGVGGYLARQMAHLYAQFFDFPFLVFRISWVSYGLAGLLGMAAAVLGAVRAAWSAARLAPAVAMSPPAPPSFNQNLVDRALTAMRLSQPSMMILRSILRWPLRAALSTLGLALAVSVLTASSFFPDSLGRIMDTAFNQANRQDAMLLFSSDLPDSALAEVARLPGVLQVEGQNYHAAILRNGHLEKRVAVEARRPGTDLSRVVDAEDRVIDVPPGGLMLSQRLAEALEVQTGDLLEVEFLSGRRDIYDLPVAGTIIQYFGLGASMDADTLAALFRRGPRVSVANVTLDAARADDFHAALKDIPNLAGSIMMTKNRRSFEDTIEENVLIMTTVYGILGILITVGVTYNGARVQLSERARELASLRILGFTRWEVSYILIGETMLLAIAAQPIGWLIGFNIARLMTNSFSSDLYSVPLVVEPATFTYASLIVLASALISVLLVRRRLDRLDLVAVMKTRE